MKLLPALIGLIAAITMTLKKNAAEKQRDAVIEGVEAANISSRAVVKASITTVALDKGVEGGLKKAVHRATRRIDRERGK